VKSALTFVLALLRGTEGHFGGVQGVLGRIASQQVVDRVREACTDGIVVWSIRSLDEVVLGLTAKSVGWQVPGLAQGDIHFVLSGADASEESQDGQRVRAIE